MKLIGKRGLTIFFIFLGLALSSCRPSYPKCDNDDHCAEQGEYCLNGQCQECREDAQCELKNGPAHVCQEGRCEFVAECQNDMDCAAKDETLVCKRGLCETECTAEANDCEAGFVCERNRCVAMRCETDDECESGWGCVLGTCQNRQLAASTMGVPAECQVDENSPSEAIIKMDQVKFEFDSFDLTTLAMNELQGAAGCLKQLPKVTIVIEGHCDERGTQEYNLALGEKRATVVKKYLRNLGVEVSRMETRSMGENQPICYEGNDACFARNRRVVFLQYQQ
ncbi:MAG: hypothetical protein CMH60_06095 [Myxococcales bacterium]|nr:hypothetical protein [Myxococcales bacterium]